MPTVASGQIAVDRGEVQLRPGHPGERIALIKVRNESAQTMQVSVLLEDWDRDEVGTNRWYKSGSVAGSCAERLTIFPGALQLAPGQEASVRVVLDSLATLDAECWAAAIVQVARVVTANGRNAQFNIRTAVKLYVTPPDLPPRGEVAEMAVQGDSVRLRFANTGKRHSNVSGRVEFRNENDVVTATLSIPDMPVLPGGTRRVTLALPTLPSGRYVVLAVLDYGGDELAAGQAEHDAKTP
jgi:P pilus assembly chaperone PapD